MTSLPHEEELDVKAFPFHLLLSCFQDFFERGLSVHFCFLQLFRDPQIYCPCRFPLRRDCILWELEIVNLSHLLQHLLLETSPRRTPYSYQGSSSGTLGLLVLISKFQNMKCMLSLLCGIVVTSQFPSLIHSFVSVTFSQRNWSYHPLVSYIYSFLHKETKDNQLMLFRFW